MIQKEAHMGDKADFEEACLCQVQEETEEFAGLICG